MGSLPAHPVAGAGTEACGAVLSLPRFRVSRHLVSGSLAATSGAHFLWTNSNIAASSQTRGTVCNGSQMVFRLPALRLTQCVCGVGTSEQGSMVKKRENVVHKIHVK